MSDKPAVHSYDEWTQIEEVIVGRVDGFAGFHIDNSFSLYYWDNIKGFLTSKDFYQNKAGDFSWPLLPIENEIVDELKEDIQSFVDALEAAGISVRRPLPLLGNEAIQTPHWESIQSPPLNIRDQTIILGTTIVETAPHVRARLFENDYLRILFYEYMQKGARWLQMPRPLLCARTLDSSFFSLSSREKSALQDHHAHTFPGLTVEIVFDGAQCIRAGKDVFVNVANKNHEMGLQWLQSNLKEEFNFHRLERMADTHIDSMILPLRPGLWLVRDQRFLDYLPAQFRNWDCLIVPEPAKDFFPSYEGKSFCIASKFIDMNVFSINDNTVVVNSLFPELVNLLECAHFTVIPVRHRHRRLFGGGFHCFTLDVRRSGDLQNYSM